VKVAISAAGPTLDAPVDPRFGRCSTFLLVETGDRSFEVHDNIPSTLGGGAGIQSASALAHLGVKAVLTGSCGPNAHETLTAAGIEVYVGCSGTVTEVLGRLEAGELSRAAVPTVPGHAGRSGGQ